MWTLNESADALVPKMFGCGVNVYRWKNTEEWLDGRNVGDLLNIDLIIAFLRYYNGPAFLVPI